MTEVTTVAHPGERFGGFVGITKSHFFKFAARPEVEVKIVKQMYKEHGTAINLYRKGYLVAKAYHNDDEVADHFVMQSKATKLKI